MGLSQLNNSSHYLDIGIVSSDNELDVQIEVLKDFLFNKVDTYQYFNIVWDIVEDYCAGTSIKHGLEIVGCLLRALNLLAPKGYYFGENDNDVYGYWKEE